MQLQQRGDGDVGQDQVIRFAALARERAARDVDYVGNAVARHVFVAHAGGDRVDLNRIHRRRAQARGGDRQDARAGPDVQDAHAWLDARLDRPQAQTRGRVQAGAEGHARVEQQHHVVGSWLVVRLPPAGHDHRALADAVYEEVLLPGVGPVSLTERAYSQRLNVAQPAERPDGFLDFGLALLSRRVAHRQVGLDQDRRVRRQVDNIAVARRFDHLLDGHALAVLSEHRRHRLHRLRLGGRGELEPLVVAHGRSISSLRWDAKRSALVTRP